MLMKPIVLILFLFSSNLLLAQELKTDTALTLPELKPITLSNVTIKGFRNYKLDSLNRRKDFASVFAYKAPGLKDIFMTRSPGISQLYSPFQNSPSNLVSVNLLAVVGLLNRNNTPVSRLQKKLLQDEAQGYVDRIFSMEKVQSLTTLSGDSLRMFMDKYRPTAEQVKEMTAYDLMVYIKKSGDEFKYKP